MKPGNIYYRSGPKYRSSVYSGCQRSGLRFKTSGLYFIGLIVAAVRAAVSPAFFCQSFNNAVSSSFFLRSEEHTSELQSLMRISYAVFCLKQKTYKYQLMPAYLLTQM